MRPSGHDHFHGRNPAKRGIRRAQTEIAGAISLGTLLVVNKSDQMNIGLDSMRARTPGNLEEDDQWIVRQSVEGPIGASRFSQADGTRPSPTRGVGRSAVWCRGVGWRVSEA